MLTADFTFAFQAPIYHFKGMIRRFGLILVLVSLLTFFSGTHLRSGKTVRFQLHHAPGIHRVSVIGTFNHWNPNKDILHRTSDSVWVLDKFLPFGRYEYRFLINGNQYLRDPENPRFGGVYSNSILWVLPEDIPTIRIRQPQWGSVIASSRVTIRLQLPDAQTARSVRKRLEVTVDGRRMRLQRQDRELFATARNLSDGFHWIRLRLPSNHWPITWEDSLFFIVNSADTPAVPRTSHFMLTPAKKIIELNGGLSYDPDYDPLPPAHWIQMDSSGYLQADTLYFPRWHLPEKSVYNSQFILKLHELQDTLHVFVRPFATPQVTFRWQKPRQWHLPIHSVQVVGEFNHWKKGQFYLLPNTDSTTWQLSLPLPPGQYEYKFVMNDTLWTPDTDNPRRIPDGWNGWNSVLTVTPVDTLCSNWQWRVHQGWLQLFPARVCRNYRVEYLIDPVHWMYRGDARISGDTLFLRHWKLGQHPLRVYALVKNSQGMVVHKRSEFIHTAKGKLHLRDYNAAPAWTRSAIAYQIYLRRFGPDSSRSGTFQDLIDRLDYLQRLGVNTVWLMPIMPSSAPHGYTPTNHFSVNPDYGTLADFRELIEALHQRGMRFIFDFVANHTGDQHPFFRSAWFNPRSPFRQWYIWQGRWQYAYHNDWDALPNLNYSNPNVRHYMLNVARFWLEQGVDGFRCDAAWGVPHSFWKDFRRVVKEYNPEAVLIDEVLPRDPSFHDEEFDMSYDTDFYGNLLDVMRGRKPVWALRYGLQKTQLNYPPGIVDFRYLENQDLPRFIEQFGAERTRVAAAFLLTVPGMPLIYYGQELGVTGMRPFMPWQKVGNDWFQFYQRLIQLRKRYPEFTEMAIHFPNIGDSTKVLSYLRGSGKAQILVALNFSSQVVPLHLDRFLAGEVLFRWPREALLSTDRLPPYGILIQRVTLRDSSDP